MKFYFIIQMIEMDTNPETILTAALKIESFRPFVTNKVGYLWIIINQQSIYD